MLRMAGTDLVWELDDSVELATRVGEIATARASNQFVTLRARLAGQTELAYLTPAHERRSFGLGGDTRVLGAGTAQGPPGR
jgi:hypothetical protein